MTVSTPQKGAPLGVGSIVGGSFSILMGNFLSVVMLALGPTLLSTVLSGLLIGWNATLGLGEPSITGVAGVVAYGLSLIAQMVAYGLTTALIVQLAYDAKLGRTGSLGRYFGPGLGAALPIAILGVASGIMMAIGLIALIVPGLWVYAVFSVMPAAVVIEKVGFGGLGRSAALTKEYRWPILGAIFLVGIITMVINGVAVFVVGMVLASSGGSGASIAMGVLVITALSAIGTGLGAITIALIYARLREIKEGTSLRDIVAVFD
jgi:hypothetical protein